MLAAITYKKPLSGLPAAGFFIVYFLLLCRLLSGFMFWNSELVAGLLIAPYVFKVARGEYSIRFLLPALITAAVSFIIPAKTPLFFALLFATLFLLESYRGKVNGTFVLLLLICSPLFTYTCELAGFPIRIWLSATAATILQAFGKTAMSTGNVISLNGAEFSVDPACAGLNMLAISFIICFFLLAHRQRAANSSLPGRYLLAAMAATFALNMLSNLLRILLLIQFNIAPGNSFHDLVGMVCLMLYAIVPLYYLIKLLYKHLAVPHEKVDERRLFVKGNTLRYIPLQLTLLLVICVLSARVKPGYTSNDSALAVRIPGYSRQVLSSGVIQFQTDQNLIYLKPTPFYGLAHDPMVCWTGSGYIFDQVKTELIAGIHVYTGTLIKGGEKIYAAWWFDNGLVKTINQFNWRWRVIKGERQFYLVNVNAARLDDLRDKVTMMLRRNRDDVN